jgi:hypothetical protein
VQDAANIAAHQAHLRAGPDHVHATQLTEFLHQGVERALIEQVGPGRVTPSRWSRRSRPDLTDMP